MSGDGGEIYQERVLRKNANDPDARYRTMTQTEIEDDVKLRSSLLLSRKHYVYNEKGKKVKFRVSEKDLEHLVDDALHRSNGTLYISDISTLPYHFKDAKYVSTAKDADGDKNVLYDYYKMELEGREIYLNLKYNKKRRERTLHSITTKIMDANQK